MAFDLHNKTALITGATGGIGRAIAKFLHQQGAHVILTGRNKENLESLGQELQKNYDIIITDLSTSENIQFLMGKINDLNHTIDILVNNAGITSDNLALRMKDEEWQKVIDLNLTSCFLLSKAMLRQMMKKKWGRIINISSVVAVAGNPGQTNYCAAKAGLIGMSKALAQEVGSRNITINCVAPGFIPTKINENLSDDVKDNFLKNVPLQRAGTTQEVAASVGFLASDEAGYITGQTLHVNGGMYMV